MFDGEDVFPWLKAIVAIGEGNRVIGNNGRLPWRYPEEAAFYRKMTSGHEIVVGRGTFQVEGLRQDVRTFVLSRTLATSDDVVVIRNINELRPPEDGKILWVCGGAPIYDLLLKHCSELYVSQIHSHYEGDAFFPEFEHLFHVKETIIDRPEWTTQILERNVPDSD